MVESGNVNLRHLMQKQVAELFSVDRLTIRNWTKQHGCPRCRSGNYDLYAVIQWWTKYSIRKNDKQNRERNLARANRFFAENREQIEESDKYIRHLLCKHTSLNPKDIPEELVALKRAHIQLKRTILEMQK